MTSATDNTVSDVPTSFRHEIIKETLKSRFTNAKNKITEEAVELISELAKVIVMEATLRAAKQATVENRKTVTLDHVETILPQLILDFP